MFFTSVHRSPGLRRIGILALIVFALSMMSCATGRTPIALASQTECFSYGYACTPGYDATNTEGGWAWKYYGESYAATPTGYHNCTLYAAWRLEQNGMANPGLWGNAVEWVDHTSHNNTPAVGSIAWWGSEVGGGFGHVAYVEQVRGSEVFIRADNYDESGGYTDAGWISDGSVDAFLHPHDLQSGPPSEGSFVSNDGFVYRIAGGAPIYVSNWNAVGGPQPTRALSEAEFAALPQYPRDGTFLNSSTGAVYRVAGGAPLFVSDWNAVGGPQAYVTVDQAAIGNAGGGVPWDHLRSYPVDGTFLNSSTGAVYRVAGGAPLFVSNWNAVGGPQPYITIDQWDIENTSNPAAHLRTYPADGTFLNTSTGAVYRVAGGAPLFVSNWDAVGGPQPYVTVDQWDIENIANPAAHLNPYPADGTFLNTSTGRVYRVAGGAPFAVSNWSVFGGVQPYVTVDEWDIENISNPAAHLNATPTNGTVVEGLPSETYWLFNEGRRSPAAAASGATQVDDAGLDAFLQLLPTAGPSPSQEGTTTMGAALGGGSSSTPTAGMPAHDVLGVSVHAAVKRSNGLARALARCRKIKSRRKRTKCEAATKRRYHSVQKRRRHARR